MLIAKWKKNNPLPHQDKPIPIQVIWCIAFVAQHLSPVPQGDFLHGVADMIIIAFFLLLWPGEYTNAPSNTTHFTLKDVQLLCGPIRLDLRHTTLVTMLNQARFGTLTFANQEKGVCGEVIGLRHNGDPYLCPIKAIICQELHLQSHGAPIITHLTRVFSQGAIRTHSITPTTITKTLQEAVKFIGFDLGFLPSDVSARSQRAAGGTALLLAKVDTDII